MAERDVSHVPREPKGSDGAGQWRAGGASQKMANQREQTNETKAMFSRVAQPDGGFTYQPLTADEPSEGFAVSPYPNRSFAKDAKDFTFDDLVEYVKRNNDMFRRRDHYIGAWHDPDSGRIFLDVSVVSRDAKTAERLARLHDQIAYFDLRAGRSVTVNKLATSGGVAKP